MHFLSSGSIRFFKDNGSISHRQAEEKAYGKYEIYNGKQPIESDFNKFIKVMIEKGGN